MTPASPARNVGAVPPWMRPSPRVLAIVVVYAVCWYAFDWAAQALEVSGTVSIWNPPAALDIALLLVCGPVFTPVIALGTLIDQWLVSDQPWPLPVVALMCLIRMVGYGGTCTFLLRVLRIDPRLRRLRDVVWFVLLASLAGPLLVALLQESVEVLCGIEPVQGWPDRMLLAWAGIATGVVVFTPVLLLLLRLVPRVWATATPAPLPLALRWPSRRATLEYVVALVGLLVGIYVAYGAPRASDLDYTYVVMLPLVWIAVRYELRGAVWAVVAINLGAAALVAGQINQQQAFALQFGLMIVSQGGLLIGALMLHQRQIVDERLRLERALADTQKMESIGRLARGVAHDFNNMLQAIRGYIHIALLEVQDGADPVDSLHEADLAVQRAADLAQQVLRSASQEPAQKASIDLNALVHETITLLKRALPKTVTVDLQLDPFLPPLVADATQLRQVVLNLVVNAAEAMHGTPGTITVSTVHSTTRDVPLHPYAPSIGQWICLSVADTGWGMPPETQARIFEPFFSTKANGHGLGLGIVQGIVQEHGGDIAVESVLGKGTTFRVWLPVQVAER